MATIVSRMRSRKIMAEDRLGLVLLQCGSFFDDHISIVPNAVFSLLCYSYVSLHIHYKECKIRVYKVVQENAKLSNTNGSEECVVVHG